MFVAFDKVKMWRVIIASLFIQSQLFQLRVFFVVLSVCMSLIRFNEWNKFCFGAKTIHSLKIFVWFVFVYFAMLRTTTNSSFTEIAKGYVCFFYLFPYITSERWTIVFNHEIGKYNYLMRILLFFFWFCFSSFSI